MATCIRKKVTEKLDDGTRVSYWFNAPPAGAAGCTPPSTTDGASDPPPTKVGSSGYDTGGGDVVYRCFPAVPASPGIPGLPPTPSSIIISGNTGWNSHARSKNALPDDHYVEFNVKYGSQAVFVGLGPVGMDGQPLTEFDHGVMFTIHGARVFENGVSGDLIASSFNTDTVMKITRDNTTVTYSVGVTDEVSANAIADTDELFVYAYLYTAGDTVFCAKFKTLAGSDVDGDVSSTAGDGAMSVSLPAFDAQLAYAAGLTILRGDLPSFSGLMVESVFVPPVPVTMGGSLPSTAFVGFMLKTRPGSIEADTTPFTMIAGDYQYGIISADLPAFTGSGYYGTRLDMDVFSSMLILPLDDAETLHILIMMDGLEITSIQALSRMVVQEMMVEMSLSSVSVMLGEYALSMNDVLGLRQYFTQTVGNQPAFDANSRVWVMNTDTAATVQFDNYAFNSYFHHEGNYYGVADNGIYLLDGDDDSGDPIQADIQLGSTQFGAGEQKRLPAVYVNASSDGKLIVKISVDGEDPWYYEARSSSDKLSKHRVDPGRGLIGTNWTFTLLNQDGDDFELADLTFIPLTGSRRI